MDYGARSYDPVLARIITADTMYDRGPQGLNRYSYTLNNPIQYRDPTGHTVESALELISQHRDKIVAVATEHNIDPVLLAGLVFSENRNDYNLIKGQDSSSFLHDLFNLPGGPEIKNAISPLVKDNPSLGITEVTFAVAAMMKNPDLVPDNYADMSREDREELHESIAKGLSSEERKNLATELNNPEKALHYGASYLEFLGSHRNYGDDYTLWLSDYNRGLSDYQTATPYGMRIKVYGSRIRGSLSGDSLGHIDDFYYSNDLRDPDELNFSGPEGDACLPGCVIWVDPHYQLPPEIDYCPECGGGDAE